MKCIGKKTLQTFQKGILMHINGTRHLLNILKENGLQYLLTSKINQDALENLFSQLRTRGGLNDHPSPLNALHRLRMILLGKNPGISSYSNTQDKNNEEYVLSTVFKKAEIILNYENDDKEIRTSDTDTTSESESLDTSFIKEENNSNEMSKDAIEDLFGWVAKKYRFKYPEIGSTTTELMKSKMSSCHDYSLPS
ncbi:THAP-type domain-containing protein [Aphis craccivora]|uniref:THAP-type domain-containing protein n=1 Tax=Aphis craccivora TaxID=307492 RepID=A0A6G0XGR6_APHCR|nr:THAP-type domain-containing protein [Aphis craccivora]